MPDKDVNKINTKIENIDNEPSGLCPKYFFSLFLK
tara:strand:- start:374 stop:478 length:105 start_codon:yes stop_codon:yes gene_type:complete